MEEGRGDSEGGKGAIGGTEGEVMRREVGEEIKRRGMGAGGKVRRLQKSVHDGEAELCSFSMMFALRQAE